VAEIDLIPADYRLERRRESALRRLAVAAGAVLLVGVTASGGLAYAASRVHAQVSQLEFARRMSDQQRTELSNLQNEHARLEQQWVRLQALRGGDDIGTLFVLIDRTIPTGDLWFDRWELQRAEAPQSRPATVSTGYRAVAPAAAPPVEANVARAQMRIVGQARDYEALSHFVRALYESPDVQDVHLERTDLRRYTTTSVVAFEIAVMLKGAA
jgi:HAMP domain-containing protein